MLDTTPDGHGLISLGSELYELESTLDTSLPGHTLQYGLATYDDYAMPPFGYASSGDHPFILRQQMTDDIEAVHTAMDGLGVHFGGDAPDASMEALYQALTGTGYDQDCDGVYDADTDISPFIASSSDPFLGSIEGSSDMSGGTIGGMGFREYSTPLIIYVTDNILRDPDDGYETPGGCPLDAGRSDVIEAAESIGATLVGVNSSSWGGTSTEQMETLATEGGFTFDGDGDGIEDEFLVFNWALGSSSTFRDTIIAAIESVATSRSHDPAPFVYSEVEPMIIGDPEGFVTDISPASFLWVAGPDDEPADTTAPMLRFTLGLEGSTASTSGAVGYPFLVSLLGDEETRLGALRITIVVPASGTE